MNKTWVAILAACTLGGAAIAADQPGAEHPRWNRADMEQMRAKWEARKADDMAVLIGLRADQRPALDGFLAAMRPPHRGPDGMRGPGPDGAAPGDATLPARLDAMAARADRRDAELKQKIAATRQFYASLTPDQQHRLEALDDLRHDHMHGDHGPMGGGDRHHGPDAPPPPGV
ncbi:Spy/CpxP family protein refolding chaperone [Sphingomonas oryzagri]|uniref:Spy/CpxP family protein refolding chaperone n=1 Tax=Sphingomonas oryzagri TaxID=3042314 RepID=A0ABT6N776_9SPHN|nr:Spy/CpxP family protein refolding chaperone [Sphingomonas oryzagri]MDH7640940.1 Spy/CpxP family protein refolding chaperone [Sphingomonas oryzagri]